MKDYIQPSLRENLDYFILHVGKNDLNKERSLKLRDHTLSIWDGWPEGFCRGHKIF